MSGKIYLRDKSTNAVCRISARVYEFLVWNATNHRIDELFDIEIEGNRADVNRLDHLALVCGVNVDIVE